VKKEYVEKVNTWLKIVEIGYGKEESTMRARMLELNLEEKEKVKEKVN
jgi:hypothetical protein